MSDLFRCKEYFQTGLLSEKMTKYRIFSNGPIYVGDVCNPSRMNLDEYVKCVWPGYASLCSCSTKTKTKPVRKIFRLDARLTDTLRTDFVCASGGGGGGGGGGGVGKQSTRRSERSRR